MNKSDIEKLLSKEIINSKLYKENEASCRFFKCK